MDAKELQWHVVFVRSNQEKRVTERLTGLGVEAFLPCYSSVRQWKDRRVKLQLPLFPSYVFVHVQHQERAKALSVSNVVSFVGARNSPAVIAEDEIAWIRSGTQHESVMPHSCLVAGQRVVVTAGALAGLEGVLVRIQNRARVVISVSSIARAFAVEVDSHSVEPVEHPSWGGGWLHSPCSQTGHVVPVPK
jgi:transcription antitermination factor NusG